jgi:hypothetical protein
MAGLGTKLHGKNGAIYIADTGGAKVKVVNKTEWTLNLNRDYVDATTFGNTNKVYLVGLKDISGTYAGLLDVSGDALVNATDSGAEWIYLYADDGVVSGSPVLVAYGPGLLDTSITASISDAIKVTGNFRASANWTVFKDGSLT